MSFARSSGVVGRATPFLPSSYNPVDAMTSTRWCLPGSYLEPAGPTPPHSPKLVPFLAVQYRPSGPSGSKYEPGKHHRVDVMASTGLYDDGKKGVARPTTPVLRAKDMDRDG